MLEKCRKRRWVSWWDNGCISWQIHWSRKVSDLQQRSEEGVSRLLNEKERVEERELRWIVFFIVLLFYAGVEFCRSGIGTPSFSLEITRKWETPENCMVVQADWRGRKEQWRGGGRGRGRRENFNQKETRSDISPSIPSFSFFFLGRAGRQK